MSNRRSARYALELKIVETLRNRLAEGDGWARITMKTDGQEIDISECYGGKYHICFPPYYGDKDLGKGEKPYKPLDQWFNGLDEVAEFLLGEKWKRYWN